MLNLALTTLPLYSLAVLLGSDLKDAHERHEPLAERLHKIFKHSSVGSEVLQSACVPFPYASGHPYEPQALSDAEPDIRCLLADSACSANV